MSTSSCLVNNIQDETVEVFPVDLASSVQPVDLMSPNWFQVGCMLSPSDVESL